MLHHILNIDGIEWNGATTQLRDVETLQTIVVEGWFPLRQDERLVSLAMLIKIAEVRLAVESVIALACKDKPSARMRPAVIGITFPAVYDAEAVYLSGLQVEHTEVCLWMPDREGAIVGNGEKTVSAVWTYFGMAYRVLCVEGIYLLTECSCSVLERDADKGIFQSLQILCLQTFLVGNAIVDVSAVG